MNSEQARKKALEILKKTALFPSATPELDVSIILSRILSISRSCLLAHPETLLTAQQELRFLEHIQLRVQGLPVAYIIGKKEFWGLSFKVTPSVLIPKADTEILVERACCIIQALEKARQNQPVQVLDVCTGSGCIAIALKSTHPKIIITATDISPAALAIAKENSDALANGNITFVLQDLREGLPAISKGWDLIVSNPPYIPSLVAQDLLQDGRREPLLALDGGSAGLDLIRPLITHSRSLLAPEGRILIETGEYNTQETATLLEQSRFSAILIHKDLENQDRVIEGIRDDRLS